MLTNHIWVQKKWEKSGDLPLIMVVGFLGRDVWNRIRWGVPIILTRKWRLQGWTPRSNQCCLQQVSCVSRVSFQPPPMPRQMAGNYVRGVASTGFFGIFHMFVWFLSGCRRTIPSISAELWPNYQPNQRVTSGKHLKSMVVQLACHSDVSAADAIHHCTIPGVFSQRHAFFCKLIDSPWTNDEKFVSWKWNQMLI